MEAQSSDRVTGQSIVSEVWPRFVSPEANRNLTGIGDLWISTGILTTTSPLLNTACARSQPSPVSCHYSLNIKLINTNLFLFKDLDLRNMQNCLA
jgi:hypothetical protein